jgi:hypothetical protein
MERIMETNKTPNEQQNPKQDHIRDIPFTEKEVSLISSCAFWMRFIGYISNISAFFYTLVGIVLMVSSLIPHYNTKNVYIGLVFVVISVLPYFMGKWIIRSSRAFMDVINTAIDDQGFLVEGFSFLQKFFLSIGVISIILITSVLLGFIYFSFSSFPIN